MIWDCIRSGAVLSTRRRWPCEQWCKIWCKAVCKGISAMKAMSQDLVQGYLQGMESDSTATVEISGVGLIGHSARGFERHRCLFIWTYSGEVDKRLQAFEIVPQKKLMGCTHYTWCAFPQQAPVNQNKSHQNLLKSLWCDRLALQL